MTKTFSLTLGDNFYFVDEGDRTKKAICIPFVEFILGKTPEELTVVASTDEIPDAYKVSVTKGGYYRWSWNFTDRQCGLNGMTMFAEESLTRIFPEAREDGLDKPHELWLQFTV